MSDPSCPSCGTPYADHLGLIGTCARVQELEAEVARLRALLSDWAAATEGGDSDPPLDPIYYPAVLRMMATNGLSGFGAVMATCQRLWRELLVAEGYPPGGEFVAGPCRATLHNLLVRSRAAPATTPTED